MTAHEHLRVADLVEFERWAMGFAATLAPGDAVALVGDLGAGKTTLVAAIARALGNADEVASPTFVFRHRYAGPTPIEHLDLYRIDDPREARELGLDDAFSDDTITFVEWPDRLPDLVPPRHIRVTIAGSGDGPRTLAVERR
jgi:tRNA threonylcarbamoyladenosine biosynthesis protein TsaE